MRLCTTLENLDNIPDGETRKIINYTAGDGIDITNGVISATGSSSISIDNNTITNNSNDMIQTVGVIDQKTGNSDKFWTGTLEEYNAITNKDDNTFYNITDDYDDRFNRDLYFQPGDKFECENEAILSGFITSGTTGVRLAFPSPKRLDNITSITCQSFKCEARGVKGYLNGQSGTIEYVGRSGYTISVNKSNNNVINISINKSSAWTNVDNNTPVVFIIASGSLTLTFNEKYRKEDYMSLRKGNKIIAGSPEIVESGSNANGTYVKYSDGRMECYKRVTQKNVKLTGTWYGLYINENDTTVDLGNYAATFIEEPVVNITYMGGNGCWLINNNYHSASSPGKVQLCTVSSRTIGTCILDITAKGRWK